MMKLQHKFRREGGVTVGDPPAHYLLDDEGVIEVTEEHAKMLLCTETWRTPEFWKENFPGMVVKKKVENGPEAVGGRAPRTREQMAEALMAEGLPVPENFVPLKKEDFPPPPERNLDKPDPLETLNRFQLVKKAKREGIKNAPKRSKAELIKLIKQMNGENP